MKNKSLRKSVQSAGNFVSVFPLISQILADQNLNISSRYTAF
jgi:hypothetical protein